MRNNRTHREQRGWVLIVAIVVMTLLLGLGLATLAIVDTQQQQGNRQRVREDSFNLAEGMLYSQSQILARNWPSTSTGAFPANCTQAAAVALCTDPATVSASTGGSNPIFAGNDFTGSGNVTWTVQVRDNGDGNGNVLTNYDRTSADGVQQKCSVSFTTTCAAAGGTLTACATNPCTYDFNGDRQVFVRAEGTVRNRTRRLVALLRLELHQVNFNGNVIQSAWLQSSNNGNNKTLVDAQPSGVSSSSTIVLTCNPATTPNCPDAQMTSGNKNQINPPDKYATNQTVNTGMSDADYSGFLAIADHYYNDASGCPSTTDPAAWSGITILDFSTDRICSLQSNGQVNSPSNPGLLIINRGGINWQGTVDYYGIVYDRNLSNSSAGLIDLSGGGIIHGQVTVDGPGGVIVGGAEPSILFDPNAAPNLKTSGTAGLVQSTWRELTPTQ